MKYNLTQSETEGINNGTILTMACYTPKNAALAELIVNRNAIRYKVEQSESPSGKNILLFFLYPDTYFKAFRVGDMAHCEELYLDEIANLITAWKEKFHSMDSVTQNN